MTDRELLELAAKAAGYLLSEASDMIWSDREVEFVHWNPLTDDGDALRLAVKLRKFPVIETWSDGDWVYLYGHEACAEPLGNDPYAATRRAIVRAAAEIGKNMK